MDTLGITEEEQSEIFSTLAAVVLLSQVDGRSNGGDVPDTLDIVERAAFNLGVPVDSLSTLLGTYQEIVLALESRRAMLENPLNGIITKNGLVSRTNSFLFWKQIRI